MALIQVIRKILQLSGRNDNFDYKTFHCLAFSQNLEHAFDNLDALNVHVLDQILNVYNHQLKLLSPQHTEWKDLHNQVLQFYEKDYFIGLVWANDHYQVIGKYGLLYILYDPLYDYPIRHTYREFMEYIAQSVNQGKGPNSEIEFRTKKFLEYTFLRYCCSPPS